MRRQTIFSCSVWMKVIDKDVFFWVAKSAKTRPLFCLEWSISGFPWGVKFMGPGHRKVSFFAVNDENGVCAKHHPDFVICLMFTLYVIKHKWQYEFHADNFWYRTFSGEENAQRGIPTLPQVQDALTPSITSPQDQRLSRQRRQPQEKWARACVATATAASDLPARVMYAKHA